MINKLGFGFLRFPLTDGELDYRYINTMVDEFMAMGGDYFDTCYTYLDGKSEEAIRKCVVERKPRDSFKIAEKLPGYKCTCYEDNQKLFEEELQRCGVDYFDVYMLHWLNGKHYEIAKKYKQFEFLTEKKAQGLAKRIGFSYHDNAALLDTILTEHPEVDIVQLQINYLDWESEGIESRKCYEVCVKHGKTVTVMEPIKGGTLASIPDSALNKLKKLHPDWHPADWALRFVQTLPQVAICLSGMNGIDQIKQNMLPFEPLTENEINALLDVCDDIKGATAISCTGCAYCEPHCPMKLPIPSFFKMYNEVKRYPNEEWKIKPSYITLSKEKNTASACVKCRKCESHCPQGLKISEFIKNVSEQFDKE